MTPTAGAVTVNGQAGHRPGSRSRAGVPGVRAVSLEDRARQRDVRARSQQGVARAEAQQARARADRAGASDGLREFLSEGIVRRHEAAGRDRPHARLPAEHPADGRAVRRARRAHPHAACRTSCSRSGSATARPCCSSPTASRRRCSCPTGWWCMTRSPGRIKEIIDIDLPRPRRRAELLVDRRYQNYVVDIERMMDDTSGASAAAMMGALASAGPGPAAAARLPRPARRSGSCGARAFDIDGLPPALEALARSCPRSWATGVAAQHSRTRCAAWRSASRWRSVVAIPLGLMMGRSRLVAAFFNPLLMIDLSGAEGGADADHHAVARRRRRLQDAGDLSRRQPAGDLSQLSGRQAVEEKMLWSAAAMGMSAAQRLMRIVLPAALPEILVGMPHRAGAGADHHGDERDDRAAVRRRQHPVQLARHGAIRHGLRHDRHHRRARLRARRRVREAARRLVGWAEPVHQIAVGST